MDFSHYKDSIRHYGWDRTAYQLTYRAMNPEMRAYASNAETRLTEASCREAPDHPPHHPRCQEPSTMSRRRAPRTRERGGAGLRVCLLPSRRKV